MADTPKKPRKPKPKIFLRVIKGGLQPADVYAAIQLRSRNYHIGDILTADLKKLNSAGFNRLHHRIGQLCAANIETFHGMDAHAVLKRIQIEGNIWCETVGVVLSGMTVEYRYPMSLDFETLEDGQRHEVARAMCRHISERYWPTMSPEKIEEMAESFVEEA